MIVSNNNNLLNILLPNDNKVLKEALKNADSQTLNNLSKGSTSVNDILQNLFDSLKNGDKSNSSLENTLKNSNVFKDFGNFSKSVDNLLNQLDPSLEKYKPALQNLLKNITDINGNNLKNVVNNSGVFLEAKALEQANINGNSTLPKNLENILNQIKGFLKDIPTLEAKNISSMIDKLLQNGTTTSLGSVTSQLQNLSKGLSDNQLSNLNNLTNLLKDISNSGQLIESKIENLNGSVQNQSLLSEKQNLINKTVDTLFALKSELQMNSSILNKESMIKLIDNLLQTDNLFSKNNFQTDAKTLLTQLTQMSDIKSLSSQYPGIESLINRLKSETDGIDTLESKVLQNLNIQNEKNSLTRDIHLTLLNLKNEISNISNFDNKTINQIIDKLLNIQNLFSKVDIPTNMNLQNNQASTFQNNFANNLNTLILNLRESIVNLSTNQENLNLQNIINKNIDKLESIANTLMQNQLLNNKQQTTNLQNDMKSVLLQMQEELQMRNDSASKESLKQIDKIIGHIEYYQLLSIVSNSNSVYIPFLWDMLDDGNISMKKIDEKKFYCEINLSLKEFGKTQLLLALYDKNKLDLTVYISKDSFKQAFRENSTKLKQALNSVNLIPMNIKVIDMKKEDIEEKVVKKQTDLYNQNSSLNMGIDIRA